MGALLLLCAADRHIGQSPREGWIRSTDEAGQTVKGGQVRIENTEHLRETVVMLVQQIRWATNLGEEIHRDHRSRRRCARCTLHDQGGEAMACGPGGSSCGACGGVRMTNCEGAHVPRFPASSKRMERLGSRRLCVLRAELLPLPGTRTTAGDSGDPGRTAAHEATGGRIAEVVVLEYLVKLLAWTSAGIAVTRIVLQLAR
jgi:hypothetical protein